MRICDLINPIDIWITNEEADILKKIKSPRLLSSFNSHDRVKLEYMIRKNLVIKRGFENPVVIANEEINKYN
jgi:hypothetical protein